MIWTVKLEYIYIFLIFTKCWVDYVIIYLLVIVWIYFAFQNFLCAVCLIYLSFELNWILGEEFKGILKGRQE